MDQQTAAKQQIVERLKQANNVLVTVSHSPTVDQLAACIGMTLFLNKLDKHATAVFSGEVPSTIEFLQPEKTIETNTDSLRDFIISLDKAKADKLRYKVEDKFVRIYITPYRTSLSEKDLMFSQGDFNVEVVLALGVKDKTQLDAAITQHGRILHDATVVSINAGPDKAPAIGQINWEEPTASSLCEMLVSISEAFGTGLIDNQMATAFLTGIVAETQRFSNPRTSPKVMTMAAQLMAAGANQQLIVSKLEPPQPPPEAAKPVQPSPTPTPPAAPPTDTLTIPHDEDKKQELEVKPGEIHIDKYGNIVSSEEIQAATTDLKAQAGAQAQSPANLPQMPTPLTATAPAPSGPLPAPVPSPTPMSPEPTSPSEPEPASTSIEMQTELPKTETQTPVPVTTPTLSEPRTAKAEPETTGVPKAHGMLDPSVHQPSISPPLSADTQPSWYDPESATPLDPLSESERPDDALIDGKKEAERAEYRENFKTINPISLSSDVAGKAGPKPSDTPTFQPPPEDGAPIVGAAKAFNPEPSADDLAHPEPPAVPPPLPREVVDAAASKPVARGKVADLAKPL